MKKRKIIKEENENVKVLIKDHRDRKGGHPHIILEDIEDKHVSVGLSKSDSKGKGSTNYKMQRNYTGKEEDSYMRRQGTVDYKKNYYGPRKGVIHKDDLERAKIYGGRAKEKYLNKGKKK